MYQNSVIKALKGIFSLAGLRAGICVLILACLGCLVFLGCSCQSNEPSNTITSPIDGDVEIDNTSEQISNNPWPYVIIALGLAALFLAYLYFSKKYIGFGRK